MKTYKAILKRLDQVAPITSRSQLVDVRRVRSRLLQPGLRVASWRSKYTTRKQDRAEIEFRLMDAIKRADNNTLFKIVDAWTANNG